MLFAAAAEAAGRRRDTIDAATLDELLEAAVERFGPRFAEVLPHCRVVVNGEDCRVMVNGEDCRVVVNREGSEPTVALGPDDEVALLPPVSGGTVRT